MVPSACRQEVFPHCCRVRHLPGFWPQLVTSTRSQLVTGKEAWYWSCFISPYLPHACVFIEFWITASGCAPRLCLKDSTAVHSGSALVGFRCSSETLLTFFNLLLNIYSYITYSFIYLSIYSSTLLTFHIHYLYHILLIYLSLIYSFQVLRWDAADTHHRHFGLQPHWGQQVGAQQHCVQSTDRGGGSHGNCRTQSSRETTAGGQGDSHLFLCVLRQGCKMFISAG